MLNRNNQKVATAVELGNSWKYEHHNVSTLQDWGGWVYSIGQHRRPNRCFQLTSKFTRCALNLSIEIDKLTHE